MSPRDISPLMAKLRDVLLGRSHMNPLRFSENLAIRSPDAPVLPEGPAHKLYGNYYFTRDARREVQPPVVLNNQNLAIESGSALEAGAARPKSRTPGKMCKISEMGPGSPFA